MIGLLVLHLLCRLPGQPGLGPAPDSMNARSLWHWHRPVAQCLASQDTLVWCGAGLSLLCLDGTEVVSETRLPGYCQDIIPQDTVLFAACGKAGLVVLDITDPTRPAVLTEVGLRGYAWNLAVHDGLAVLALGGSGLASVDVSAPAFPRNVQWTDPADSVKAVAVNPDAVFLACHDDGLVVLDHDLSFLARLRLPGPALDLALVDTLCFVACLDSGLVVVNVARPGIPEPVLRAEYPGVTAVDLLDGFGVAHYAEFGASLFDLADPLDPFPWFLFEFAGTCVDASMHDNTLVLAALETGLHRFDLATPWEPLELGPMPMHGRVHDIAVEDAIGWTCLSDGIVAIDLETGTSLGTCSLPGRAIALGSGFALALVDDSTAATLDIADPAQPSVLALFPVPGSANCLALDDNHGWLGTADSGILRVDLADPSQPRLLPGAVAPGPVNGLHVERDLLAAAVEGFGTVLFDARTLTELSGIPLPGRVFSTSIRGNLAAVCGDSGLFLLGIRDPANPEVLSRTGLVAEAREVVLADSLCWLAADWAGLVVYNVRDPGFPWATAWYGGPTRAWDLSLVSGDAVLADSFTGLSRIRLDPLTLSLPEPVEYPTRLWTPGVVRSVGIPVSARCEASPGSLALLDPTGRRISLARLEPAAGWQTVVFPSFPLGAGVYFVVLDSDSGRETRRVQLLR